MDRAVPGVAFLAMAIISFFITYRQHREKGFVFTNEWVWASKKERAKTVK